jgi:hypothetical protein
MSSKAAPASSNNKGAGGSGKRAVKPTVALLESAESAAALTAAVAPVRSSKKAKPNKAPGEKAGAAGTPWATGAAASASSGGAPAAEGKAEAEGAEAAADKQPKAKKSVGSSRKEASAGAGAGAGGPSRPSASKEKDKKEDKKEEKDGAASRAGQTRPINFGKSYSNVDPLRVWEDEAALVGSMSIDELVKVGSVVFESGVTQRSPYGFWQVDSRELERRVLALGLPFGNSRTATIWKLLSLGRLPTVGSDTDATKWWGPFTAEDQLSLSSPEPDKLWYPEQEGWMTKNYSHAFLRLTTNKVAWAENRARVEQKVSVLSDIAAARALIEQTSTGMTGELRQMLDRQRTLSSGYSGGGNSSSSSAKDSEPALPEQALLALQQQVQQAGGTGVGFGGLPAALDSEQLQQLLAHNQRGLSEQASKTSPPPDGSASVSSTASAAVAATTGVSMQSDVGFMLWVRRCRAVEVGTVLRAVKLATDGIQDKSELLAKNSAIEQEVDKFYKTLELEWHSLPDAARTMYRLQGEIAAREQSP